MEPSPSIWSVLGSVSFFVGVVSLIAAALAGVLAVIEVLRLRWHVRRCAKTGSMETVQ